MLDLPDPSRFENEQRAPFAAPAGAGAGASLLAAALAACISGDSLFTCSADAARKHCNTAWQVTALRGLHDRTHGTAAT